MFKQRVKIWSQPAKGGTPSKQKGGWRAILSFVDLKEGASKPPELIHLVGSYKAVH